MNTGEQTTEKDDVRGTRIFQDFNKAFQSDLEIDEFDVIPVLEAECNKNPVITAGNKLGLEAWAVPSLFLYAYRQLLDKPSGDEDKVLLTRVILLINSECYTVWNIRKSLLLAKAITPAQELTFTSLVLGKHPKSPETFTQRKWILATFTDVSNKDIVSCLPCTMDLLIQEMRVCQRAAEHYASNYSAWSHRLWTLQRFLSGDNDHTITFLHNELRSNEHWVWMHVSDHSGFHYRHVVLDMLSRLIDDGQLFDRELDLSQEMIQHYPDHEALWYHRRFVVSSRLSQSSTHGLQKKAQLDPAALLREQHLVETLPNRLSAHYLKWIRQQYGVLDSVPS